MKRSALGTVRAEFQAARMAALLQEDLRQAVDTRPCLTDADCVQVTTPYVLQNGDCLRVHIQRRGAMYRVTDGGYARRDQDALTDDQYCAAGYRWAVYWSDGEYWREEATREDAVRVIPCIAIAVDRLLTAAAVAEAAQKRQGL